MADSTTIWYELLWALYLYRIKVLATMLKISPNIYTRAANMPGGEGEPHYQLIKVLLIAVYNRALRHNFGIDIKLFR